MNKLNFIKPNKKNMQSFLFVGCLFIFISILDVLLKSAFKISLTSFLPRAIVDN